MSISAKQKIMVIDDLWTERQESYNTALNSTFDIVPITESSEISDKLQEVTVDAYLIDLILDKWKDKYGNNYSIMKVFEYIKENSLILLISNNFNTLITEDKTFTNFFSQILDECYKRKLRIGQLFKWSNLIKPEAEDLDIPNAIKESINIHKQNRSDFNNSAEFDFLLITALEEELQPFLDRIDDKQEQKITNNIVMNCTLKTSNNKQLKFLAVTQPRMGNVDTAIITSNLLSLYKFKYVIMTGVCGGREGEVKIGDIIVPDSIVAYEKGKTSTKGIEFDNEQAQSAIAHTFIFSDSKKICKSILQSYTKMLIEKGQEIITVSQPHCYKQPMASGSLVISEEGLLDTLAIQFGRKLCAVDMESFGIYRTCEVLKTPAVVIKSVMDLSSNKSDKYIEYAAFVAANYLYEILYNKADILFQNENV